MNKLMVLVSAVALAFAGQAASVDWKMNIANQGEAWSAANAYVMAFNGSDYNAVIKLLTVTGSDNMATDLNTYALSLTAGGTSASVSNSRKAASAIGTSAGVTSDDSIYSMFWVVFTEGNMDAKSAISWTAATDVSKFTYEAGSSTPGTFGFTSFANSGTIASVPEPTSGLLMLVGLAGLALRRRRA